MPDPAAATSSQLRNIERSTGRTMADFAAAVAAAGVDGHAKIVAFLKAEFGLSYGNANAVAHVVREMAAGGPTPATDLLDAQYAGPKAALRPIYDRLRSLADSLGPDVEVVPIRDGVVGGRAGHGRVVSRGGRRRWPRPRDSDGRARRSAHRAGRTGRVGRRTPAARRS